MTNYTTLLRKRHFHCVFLSLKKCMWTASLHAFSADHLQSGLQSGMAEGYLPSVQNLYLGSHNIILGSRQNTLLKGACLGTDRLTYFSCPKLWGISFSPSCGAAVWYSLKQIQNKQTQPHQLGSQTSSQVLAALQTSRNTSNAQVSSLLLTASQHGRTLGTFDGHGLRGFT